MRFDRLAIHAFALLALSHAPLPFQKASSALLVRAEATADVADAVDDDANIKVEEDTYMAPESAETFKFEAEVSKMLDIVVNSLYQNKDVFLRELISNASDALDKIRFLSLTKPDYLDVEDKLQIQVEFDPEHNTLTVRDTGIGMTHQEMVSNLGTVARSGTTRFMQALKESGDSNTSGSVSQIGQFGVGFYSAFLVSERIQVASKHPDSEEQWIWTSTNGASEFQLFPDPRGQTLTRGSEITLFLKEDCMEYADQAKLAQLAKHYSEFVVHPIFLRTVETMEVEVEEEEEVATDDKEGDDEDDLEVSEEEDPTEEEEEKPKKMKEVTTFEWERLNGSPAIWTRSKEDITDAEYGSFYKLIAKDESVNAASWTHFNAEGNINFKSILYLPTDIPQGWQSGGGVGVQASTGLSLYVQKVLISDEFELLPRYLSFMKGVVDSDDLPLNVNRETLQESKIIQVIRKKVVRKALEMIKKFIVDSETEETVELDEDGEVVDKTAETKKRQDKYNDWVKKFSPSLKAGAIEDEPNRAKIMKCLRFSSTKTGKDGFTSLETYVENMKEWQKEIYFVAGMQQEGIEKSQFLEPFHQKDIEVLYFTDPMDEYLTQNVKLFDSKKFINIASESVKFKDEDEDLEKRKEKFYKEKYKPLTKWLKKLYGASIMRVVISKRLVSAPAIASSAEFGHSANMERILRAQAYSHGQHDFGMRSMKIFEINPRHPLIVKLLEGAPSDEEGAEEVVDADTENAAWLLHEMALLNGGFPLTDPEAHTQRMMKFMSSSLGVESMELEAEPDLPVEEEEAPDFSEFDLDAFAEEYEKEERDAIPLKADADADEDDDEYEAPTIGKNGGMDDMDAFASMYAKNQKAHGPKGTGPEDAIPLKADADGNIDLSEL